MLELKYNKIQTFFNIFINYECETINAYVIVENIAPIDRLLFSLL